MNYTDFMNTTDKGLRKIRSLVRNTIKCPAEFINSESSDKVIRAIQKSLKTENKSLFDEASRRIETRYHLYCIRNDLFMNSDNRRYKRKGV